MKPIEGKFLRDYSLLDLATEKVRDVWPNQPRPWAQTVLKKDTSSAESHFLYTLAKEQGPGNYADLGCLLGGSSATMAHALEETAGGIIYAVDYFGDGPVGEDVSANMRAPRAIQRYFEKTFSKVALRICKGSTAEHASLIHEKFQGIFIDAGHDYENCKQDFELWGPKVAVGGWVAFHDTNFLGVDQVIREVDPKKWKLIKHVYSTKAYRKVRAS